VALAACGGGGSSDGGDGAASVQANDPATTTTTVAPAADDPLAPSDENVTRVAAAEVPQVAVYAEADDAGPPIHQLANPTESGSPLVFTVDGDATGIWLKVNLPVRPNGSQGYIRSADVQLGSTDYSVKVELGAHRLTVTKGTEVVVDTPIGVGTAETPTPGGVYYLKELLQPPDPSGAYGPYAYGLSGFSNNPELADFAGGDGIIGIHGTNQPDRLGTDVSHGCIRVSNEVITEMAASLPLGTPVEIVA
jgi:lipoprotein-anchoring transpeptidase ErfK/SrfK